MIPGFKDVKIVTRLNGCKGLMGLNYGIYNFNFYRHKYINNTHSKATFPRASKEEAGLEGSKEAAQDSGAEEAKAHSLVGRSSSR